MKYLIDQKNSAFQFKKEYTPKLNEKCMKFFNFVVFLEGLFHAK